MEVLLLMVNVAVSDGYNRTYLVTKKEHRRLHHREGACDATGCLVHGFQQTYWV
jgi:hypothetical protein